MPCQRCITAYLIVMFVALLVTAAVWLTRRETFAVPTWATPNTKWPMNNDVAQTSYKQNVQLVTDANMKNTRYDVVMYGDSITAGFKYLTQAKSGWLKQYVDVPRFAALGVQGNRVEDLAWRLMAGGEKLVADPTVVVLWIGTNNLRFNEKPQINLEVLIDWMKTSMPASKIILVSLLPRKQYDVRPTNAAYKALAAKVGVMFAECATDVNPNDPKMFPDGLHPAEPVYHKVFACLGPMITKLTRYPRALVDPATDKLRTYMNAK